MTTKALDTWMNAKPEDRKFLLCELSICSEWVRDAYVGGFTKADNKRCSLVVKAARTILKQIADGSLILQVTTTKRPKAPKKGAKK
jgi:hypothetical protein